MIQHHFTRQRAIAVVLVLIVLVLWVIQSSVFWGLDRGTYQAVFLTNNQMYLGKLSHEGQYLRLDDVYYLKTNPQELQESKSQPQLSLVKFGGEIHQPQDALFISRDQVLYWENLREDSKIVEYIKQRNQRGAEKSLEDEVKPEVESAVDSDGQE